MIYPENFEKKIGFDKVREMLEKKCLSSLGRTMVQRMEFSSSFEFIKTLLDQTEEFRQICMFEDSFPVNNYIDVRESLTKIRVEGTFLDVFELHNLKRSLDTIKAITNFFRKRDDGKYPALIELSKPIDTFPEILNRIDGIINKNGVIRDNASPQLLEIRNSIRSKESSVSRVMHSILKRAQSEGLVDSDISLAIREGRAVIPVNASDKRKIKGYVLDESATGKTVYIEPVEIIEVNNEIKELRYAENREIIKILTEFTDFLRPYIDNLIYSYEYLGLIDFIRAKALFAILINADKPIVEDKQQVFLRDAVHPLLFLSLKNEGRNVVPLNIRLDKEQRILLISGPNAGGKSVCLKTVGILQYMMQCGMLVSALANSEMGIFKKLFIDIGDEQSIENDLSTYSSHLVNMKNFVKNANERTLLLIDEFGTGTEPMLGGAIAEAVLQDINNNKALGVITTHYTNLKHFASSAEGIQNAAMMFDLAKIEPLFRLEIGKPGSSFAFEIARKIGISEKILAMATNLIGEDHISFDKHLRDIARDKRYWENKRSKIKDNEKKLDKVLERYGDELQQVKELRKEIIHKAKKEAQEIVDGANKEIEKTIRTIKEVNAEKEKTNVVRKKFEKFRDSEIDSKSEEDLRIEKKIKQLKDRETKKQTGKKESVKAEKKKIPVDVSIKVGDKVKLIGQSTVGEVVEINKGNLLVAFGSLMTSISDRKVEKISKTEFRKKTKTYSISSETSFSLHEKKLDFKQEIDVRGKRVEEVLREITEYIDDAIMVGTSDVKILHGKGNGVLRQYIREYLHTVDVVSYYGDEHVDFGGAGITIVKFNYRQYLIRLFNFYYKFSM